MYVYEKMCLMIELKGLVLQAQISGCRNDNDSIKEICAHTTDNFINSPIVIEVDVQ